MCVVGNPPTYLPWEQTLRHRRLGQSGVSTSEGCALSAPGGTLIWPGWLVQDAPEDSCCEHKSCVLSTGVEHHFLECVEENSVVTEAWNSARFLLWESHSASEYVLKALRIPTDKKYV